MGFLESSENEDLDEGVATLTELKKHQDVSIKVILKDIM